MWHTNLEVLKQLGFYLSVINNSLSAKLILKNEIKFNVLMTYFAFFKQMQNSICE